MKSHEITIKSHEITINSHWIIVKSHQIHHEIHHKIPLNHHSKPSFSPSHRRHKSSRRAAGIRWKISQALSAMRPFSQALITCVERCGFMKNKDSTVVNSRWYRTIHIFYDYLVILKTVIGMMALEWYNIYIYVTLGKGIAVPFKVCRTINVCQIFDLKKHSLKLKIIFNSIARALGFYCDSCA